MKNRVRQTLEEIGTGRSDCKLEGGTSLQLDEFLEKLKETDGHASRNIFFMRKEIMKGQSPKVLTPLKSNSARLPTASSADTKSMPKKKLAKKDILYEQEVVSVTVMADTMVEANIIQRTFMLKKGKN